MKLQNCYHNIKKLLQRLPLRKKENKIKQTKKANGDWHINILQIKICVRSNGKTVPLYFKYMNPNVILERNINEVSAIEAVMKGFQHSGIP